MITILIAMCAGFVGIIVGITLVAVALRNIGPTF